MTVSVSSGEQVPPSSWLAFGQEVLAILVAGRRLAGDEASSGDRKKARAALDARLAAAVTGFDAVFDSPSAFGTLVSNAGLTRHEAQVFAVLLAVEVDPSLHLEVAIPAALAGCHLLLEKPISHSLDRLDELQRALP